MHNTTGVYWSTNNCQGTAKGAKLKKNCNHMVYWPYTRVDGFMARACQASGVRRPLQVLACRTGPQEQSVCAQVYVCVCTHFKKV